MPDLTQICRLTGKSFVVSEWEQDFLKRMQMPVPTLCPEERQRKRLAHRNERTLYKRGCDLCKKVIIAIYPEGTSFPVYCSECWWGDAWDPMTYGRDFDFGRPFFDQFKEVYFRTPRVGVLSRNGENSEYTNCEEESKNCYLTFAGGYSEDCMYCYLNISCKDCVDCSLINHCELCYEGLELENCYHCFYLQNSQNCSDCVLGVDLISCKNCFGCKGLRNKEFYIFNEPYSKEAYEAKMTEFSPLSAEVRDRFSTLCTSIPSKYAHLNNCENCTGDYLLNSQNCFNSFDIKNGKDLMHVYMGQDLKDTYDSNVVFIGTELIYNSQSICLNCFQVRCCNFSWNISFSDYCDFCHYSKNLFGCIGLKRKEYCVLNKQYSKEEYEALVPRIIEHMRKAGEWGEFFPYSVFAYNETLAQEYFPLTKEEALKHGYEWKEAETREFTAIPGAKACESCKKVFKCIQKELDFYRNMKLPEPTKCHDCRHKTRMTMHNPRQLWKRDCMKCLQAVETSYSPDRREIVYCEKCYLETVY